MYFSCVFLFVSLSFGQTSGSDCSQCDWHLSPVAVAAVCGHCRWLRHYVQRRFRCVSVCSVFIYTRSRIRSSLKVIFLLVTLLSFNKLLKCAWVTLIVWFDLLMCLALQCPPWWSMFLGTQWSLRWAPWFQEHTTQLECMLWKRLRRVTLLLLNSPPVGLERCPEATFVLSLVYFAATVL